MKLITDLNEIQKICLELKSEPMIAVDTEFIRETTFYPKLEIIQLATREKVWLVDAQVLRDQPPEKIAFLKDLLQDQKVLKVIHASQADQECFYVTFGYTVSPAFDTALGAALCGHGEAAGLSTLLKNILNIKIKKGHARTHWSKRPLTPQQLEYAALDVQHLVELAEKIISDLEGLGRKTWALELSAKYVDPKNYESDPDEMAERLSQSGRVDFQYFPVLRELMRWRESRARTQNVPRKWICDDTVLVDLTRVRPKDVKGLESFRGLNRGEIKHQGDVILSAIKKGLEEKVDRPQRFERFSPPDQEEARAADLIKVFVGLLADQKKIAQKFLIPSGDYIKILRFKAKNSQEWVEQGLLSHGAQELIGDELYDFISGQCSLSINESRIQILRKP